MESDVSLLLENLKEQERISARMLALSRQQYEASSDPVMNGDSILSQKARLVGELQMLISRARLIEDDLAQKFNLPEFTINGLKGHVEEDVRCSLGLVAGQVGILLKSIIDADAKTTELIQSRLARIKGPQVDATNSARALQAYQNSTRWKRE